MGFVTEVTFTPQATAKYQRAWRTITALAEQISDLIEQGNAKGLQAALDAAGEGMAPVKRTEGGPPLIPHNASSRFITKFKVRLQVLRNKLRFRCYWPNLNYTKYHETGTRNMPRRNPSGIRPVDVRLIERAIKNHFSNSVQFTLKTDVRF